MWIQWVLKFCQTSGRFDWKKFWAPTSQKGGPLGHPKRAGRKLRDDCGMGKSLPQ